MAGDRCPARVHWWDCDLNVSCRLQPGHGGWHTDGVRWFDLFGRQQPIEAPDVAGIPTPEPCR